ncbi:MAG: hypothetical protein KY476_11670, partial [Planctomycetes bacterium]|nr:hypothetical protein [Planctomycetota bacterium]
SALWQSLIRWLVSSAGLAPGQDRLLRIDRVAWTAGEAVSAVLLMREEATQGPLPAIELIRPDNRIQNVTPVALGDEAGVYNVSFGTLPEGRYRARIAAGEGDEDAESAVAFDVRRHYGEQLDVRARPDLMARIARDSGGSVIESGDPAAVADRFRSHLARSRPERVRRIAAWDRWWVLAGVLALWACAWGLRRHTGLV